MGSCGTENMPLNTGDARERTRLRAWNSFPPDARNMPSASGGFCHSVAMVKGVDKELEPRGVAHTPESARRNFPRPLTPLARKLSLLCKLSGDLTIVNVPIGVPGP